MVVVERRDEAHNTPRRCRHAAIVRRDLWSNENVKPLRLAAVGLILVVATWLASSTKVVVSPVPANACSNEVLMRGHREGDGNHANWMKVYRFGCAGGYAFAWALVGDHGRPLFDITDVLQWSSSTLTWISVNRAVVCFPTILPREIYLEGCFSN